jgi:hypothetical protein
MITGHSIQIGSPTARATKSTNRSTGGLIIEAMMNASVTPRISFEVEVNGSRRPLNVNPAEIRKASMSAIAGRTEIYLSPVRIGDSVIFWICLLECNRALIYRTV